MSATSKKMIGYVIIAIITVGIGIGVSYFAFSGPGTGPTTGGQKKLKAAFLYVGPLGEGFGWNYAHEEGRRIVQKLFNTWLITNFSSNVPEGQAQSYIDNYISLGYDVIFTTSFGYMDATYESAQNHPNTLFFHCGGYKHRANMGTYYAEMYQGYYLDGLLAGALTKTGKLGVVAPHLIPEIVRLTNAFAIGAQESYSLVHPGQNVTIAIRVLHSWYDPTKARLAASDLLSTGVDVLEFAEDSPTVVQVAEEKTESGSQVYTFSHYTPMLQFGNRSVVSGHLVHWEVIYEDILMKIRLGIYNSTDLENVDYWWMLKEGAIEMGADYGVPINPRFIPELQSLMVNDTLLGHISMYNYVMTRLAQMSQETVVFDPFTGPLYANNGTLIVPSGQRLDYLSLMTMDWFVAHIEQPSG